MYFSTRKEKNKSYKEDHNKHKTIIKHGKKSLIPKLNTEPWSCCSNFSHLSLFLYELALKSETAFPREQVLLPLPLLPIPRVLRRWGPVEVGAILPPPLSETVPTLCQVNRLKREKEGVHKKTPPTSTELLVCLKVFGTKLNNWFPPPALYF